MKPGEILGADWWAVYGLVDPRTNKVRYVGISRKPQARYSQHLSSALRCLWIWFADLNQLGLEPQLRILGAYQGEAAAKLGERHWIQQYQYEVFNRNAMVPKELTKKGPPTLQEYARQQEERGLTRERVIVPRSERQAKESEESRRIAGN